MHSDWLSFHLVFLDVPDSWGWKIAIPPVCEDIFFKSVCGGEHRLTLAWWSTEMDANKYPIGFLMYVWAVI